MDGDAETSLAPDSFLEAINAARAGALRVNTRDDAVDSLEMTGRFLEEAADDPRRWKWALIALYMAIQGFMVLALRGTWGVATYKPKTRRRKLAAHAEVLAAVESKDEARIKAAHQRDAEIMGEHDLDSFLNLYARIKDKDHWAMTMWGNDTFFEADNTCDQCMVWLKYLRDDYSDFTDGGRIHWLPRFALIAVNGLNIIEFLMNRTNLIMWVDWEDNEGRAGVALLRAQAAAERLQATYPEFVAEPPKGVPQESMIDMFFRRLREAQPGPSVPEPGTNNE
jgi:hypothetical protein